MDAFGKQARRSIRIWNVVEAASVAVLIVASVAAILVRNRGTPVFYDAFERRAVVEHIDSGVSAVSSILRQAFKGEMP